MGRLFRWDNDKEEISSLSYIPKLNDTDHSRSLGKPGTPTIGPFRSVYTFENEALDEVINRTVHAFSLYPLGDPTPGLM